MNLTRKILIWMLMGIIVGLIFNLLLPGWFEVSQTYVLAPLGKLFVNLIKMLVVPLVLFSIILGTAGISDPKKLGRIGAKTIGYFLVTTAIAIVIAISLALIFQPGTGDFQLDSNATFEGKEAPPIMSTLLNIIPTNPFQSLANGEVLQIIAFAVFVGLGLSMLREKTKGILNWVEQANEIMMYLVGLVMKVAPYGAFALIAIAIGGQGFDAIMAMGAYMLIVLAALLLHSILTYGTAVSLLGKMKPLHFFKGFSPAIVVAFSTSSSNATLPISMETAQKNLNVPKNISSFVQPLGATINMDGTAIMQGVATIFIAQVYGIDLGIGALLTVIVTATLASIGTAGVPGVGLIMLSMVLVSVGLPVEGIALILGVDRLLDMCRTAVNITGDASAAVIISATEKDA